GLYATGVSFDVSGTVFEDNTFTGLYFDNLGAGSSLALRNNTFSRNGYAAFLNLVDAVGQVVASGNSASGNAVNGVGLQGTVNGAMGFDWSQQTDFALRLASDLTVKSLSTLTLSAGTTVKAGVNGNQILVDGSLVARGTVAQPVVFTSIQDDSVGGDTNGDGTASLPAPGDWGQIWLRSGSTGNVFDHCVVSYAGRTNVNNVIANLRVDTREITLTDSTFRRSRQQGVYAPSVTFDVRNSVFDGNLGVGLFFDALTGNVASTLDGNTFLGNSGHAVFFDLRGVSGQVTARGNSASGNAINGVGIRGAVAGAFQMDWSAQANLPVQLYNADLAVNAGAVLTLSPGTVIKAGVTGNQILVDGSLVARGTAAQPIIFTSILDDSVGGDTNNDQAASSPGPGDWGQIWLRSGSTGNIFDHCVVTYAGRTNVNNVIANLRVDTRQLQLTNSVVRKSRQNGLYATGVSFDVSGTVFEDNTFTGLYFDNLGAGSSLALRNNTFSRNGYAAFLNLV